MRRRATRAWGGAVARGGQPRWSSARPAGTLLGMRASSLRGACGFALLVAACSPPPKPTSTDPVESGPGTSTAEGETHASAGALAPPPSASASASALVSASPPPEETGAPIVDVDDRLAMEARFKPRDTTCSTDQDCAVTQYGVSERLFCCDGCDAVAGEKAWVARANAACKAYQSSPSRHACPARDCLPPGPARCTRGRCELVPTRP